ncbi:MAG TPA: hypothetical protein VIG62_23290 [Blastocatellia bacterium]
MSDTSARSISASGTTGGTVSESGPYKCGSHGEVVVFLKRGQKFPACPNSTSSKGHSTTWRMVA